MGLEENIQWYLVWVWSIPTGEYVPVKMTKDSFDKLQLKKAYRNLYNRNNIRPLPDEHGKLPLNSILELIQTGKCPEYASPAKGPEDRDYQSI